MATDFERALNEKAWQDMCERTELHWREQIAKEIEAELLCLCGQLQDIELQHFPESTSFPLCNRCIAASIARGKGE